MGFSKLYFSIKQGERTQVVLTPSQYRYGAGWVIIDSKYGTRNETVVLTMSSFSRKKQHPTDTGAINEVPNILLSLAERKNIYARYT